MVSQMEISRLYCLAIINFTFIFFSNKSFWKYKFKTRLDSSTLFNCCLECVHFKNWNVKHVMLRCWVRYHNQNTSNYLIISNVLPHINNRRTRLCDYKIMFQIGNSCVHDYWMSLWLNLCTCFMIIVDKSTSMNI